MKKSNIFITLVFFVFSAFSHAEQALSKDLITSFQKMSSHWDKLEQSYPGLSTSLDDMDLSEPDKIISQIKNSKAYPQIKSVLASYGFDNVEEYYNVAVRIMGGMMGYQLQNMPQGMDVDSTTKMLKQSIQQMKARNAPSAMVDEMEKQLVDMEKNMKNMKEAMKNTSEADKKFISDNVQWIMSVLDEE
jgi:hypothetical protein